MTRLYEPNFQPVMSDTLTGQGRSIGMVFFTTKSWSGVIQEPKFEGGLEDGHLAVCAFGPGCRHILHVVGAPIVVSKLMKWHCISEPFYSGVELVN